MISAPLVFIRSSVLFVNSVSVLVPRQSSALVIHLPCDILSFAPSNFGKLNGVLSFQIQIFIFQIVGSFRILVGMVVQVSSFAFS